MNFPLKFSAKLALYFIFDNYFQKYFYFAFPTYSPSFQIKISLTLPSML
jgi:hypothetical protein